MKSKFDLSCKFLDINSNLFICPYCKKNLIINEHSLVCDNNHNFNISKKGTINLLINKYYKGSEIYNRFLFENRRKFIKGNFYISLYNKIADLLNAKFNDNVNIRILDLGCGEGLHSLNILKKLEFDYNYFGFDYSKDAINLASDYIAENKFFFVGNVENIPLKDKSFDIVIDILSPYNEMEVKRLIKNNGLFIKVCPGNDYLKELRNNQGMDVYRKKGVIESNLKKQFNIIEKIEINDVLSVNEEYYKYLLYMTPIKKKNYNVTSDKITIDIIIYIISFMGD